MSQNNHLEDYSRFNNLPPAPSGPMSIWGKVLEIAQNTRNLLTLLGRDPSYFPWIDFPPDGQSYDFTNVIPTPAMGVETTVLTVPIQKGWDGCVLRISNNYLGPTNSINYGIPSLTWRIKIDQRLVQGYSAIITEFGSTQFPRPISPILVNSGQTLRYTVLNSDPGLPTVGTFIYAQFGGHIWPHIEIKK